MIGNDSGVISQLNEQQQRADDRHRVMRAEQRAAVGRRRGDQRQRHQRRRRAVRAEQHQHRGAGEKRGHLRERAEMLPEPRAPRRAVDRPDRGLLDRDDARRRRRRVEHAESQRLAERRAAAASRHRRSTSAAIGREPAGRTRLRPRDADDARRRRACRRAAAGPPGHTRKTVTRRGRRAVATSGGRITATGRGAASVPNTVSPDNASPGTSRPQPRPQHEGLQARA